MADMHSRVHRVSCVECQRRKQKCSRQWPCNHCQKRKVADRCRFNGGGASTQGSSKKRSLGQREDESDVSADSDHEGDLGEEVMAYITSPVLASLASDKKCGRSATAKLDWVTVDTSPRLRRAFEVLPQRQQMDSMIQTFFSKVNYQYYLIYPPRFLQDYQDWWDRRSRNEPVTLQWTSLLAIMCSCVPPYLDLDPTLGESAESFTELYEGVSRDLACAIPFDHYHVLNLQRGLHFIYRYKSEARYDEAWHLIGVTIREAQALGIHRESEYEGLPEFEQEMRRRAWCVLVIWDWIFAAGLGRKPIIDHHDVDVGPPTLALEENSPSPLLHVTLQSEISRKLALRFGSPIFITSPSQIREFKDMIQDWMDSLPSVYSMINPDHSKDAVFPWIVSQRFYIQATNILTIVNPIRAFMTKTLDRTPGKEELDVWSDGVNYCLQGIDITRRWAEYSSHKDGRHQHIIFSLFNTASILCAAIIKDRGQLLPRRQEILTGIDLTVETLRRISPLSKSAKTSYGILARISSKLAQTAADASKRARLGQPLSSREENLPPGQQGVSISSAADNGSYNANSDQATVQPAWTGNPGFMEGPLPLSGTGDGVFLGAEDMGAMLGTNQGPDASKPVMEQTMGSFSAADSQLGTVPEFWDWQSLDVDYILADAALQGSDIM